MVHVRRRRYSRSRDDDHRRQRTGNSNGDLSRFDYLRSRREHSISIERDISRERERLRRKQQVKCIRRAGGLKNANRGDAAARENTFWDGFQWVARTGGDANSCLDPAALTSTRKMRRLYFGNLPYHLNLTELQFQTIVWEEMKKRNFCNDCNINPVLYVWFARDKGNYAFVEFQTVEETERAITMDGMNVLGVMVRISRPNDYSNTSGFLQNVLATLGQQAARIGDALIDPNADPVINVGPEKSCTKCVRLSQVSKRQIDTDEEYNEILDDVISECEKFGKIVQKCIITPRNINRELFELCDILLLYEENESADICAEKLLGRKYEGDPLHVARFDEEAFRKLVEPISIKL